MKKIDRGCWLMFAYAPDGTTMRDANDAINAYVADEARGLCLFHDHFADRAGGTAVFAIETDDELDALRQPGPLEGWDVHLHPLIFSGDKLGFLFQCDYTMIGYRKRRLSDLYAEYMESELGQRNAAREID